MTNLLKSMIDSLPMPKNGTWGGKREGAGRKPLEGKRQEDHTLSLTARRWTQLDSVGDGNYSRGVRVLLDWWAKTHKKGK